MDNPSGILAASEERRLQAAVFRLVYEPTAERAMVATAISV